MINHPGINKNSFSADNQLQLISGGSNFFETLESLIDRAKHFIFLQTYIFEDDKTGIRIQKALIRAAKRKVKIYILVDAYGSSSLSKNFVSAMEETGIQFHYYGPFFSHWEFHISRRMHHKIIVADGHEAIVGGRNISDHYNDLPGNPAWLDFAVHTEGAIVEKVLLICLRKWWRKNVRKLPVEFKLNTHSKPHAPSHERVQVLENDPLLNKNEISQAYKKAFRLAEKEILIVGAYFIPGYFFRYLMKQAVKKGVQISVITGKKSDVGLAANARRFLYNWMFRNNFKIFEYTKSNVHGKVAVVDQEWSTLGSYDLNYLSSYTNIELNLEIEGKAFSKKLHANLKKIMEEDCIEITSETLHLSIFMRFRLWLSYRAVRFLFWVSKILVIKRRNRKTHAQKTVS